VYCIILRKKIAVLLEASVAEYQQNQRWAADTSILVAPGKI
jgi:hypothetical protein